MMIFQLKTTENGPHNLPRGSHPAHRAASGGRIAGIIIQYEIHHFECKNHHF